MMKEEVERWRELEEEETTQIPRTEYFEAKLWRKINIEKQRVIIIIKKRKLFSLMQQ